MFQPFVLYEMTQSWGISVGLGYKYWTHSTQLFLKKLHIINWDVVHHKCGARVILPKYGGINKESKDEKNPHENLKILLVTYKIKMTLL